MPEAIEKLPPSSSSVLHGMRRNVAHLIVRIAISAAPASKLTVAS